MKNNIKGFLVGNLLGVLVISSVAFTVDTVSKFRRIQVAEYATVGTTNYNSTNSLNSFYNILSNNIYHNSDLMVASNSAYGGLGTKALTDDGTYKVFTSVSDNLWTNKSSVLQPKDLTLPLKWTNFVYFDVGFSNYFYSAGGEFLFLSTNALTPAYDLVNGNGNVAKFTMTSSGGAVIQATANQLADLRDSSTGVRYLQSVFSPITDSAIDLGSTTLKWRDFYFLRNAYIGTGTSNQIFNIDNRLYFMGGEMAGSQYTGIGVTNSAFGDVALFLAGGNLANIRGSAGVSIVDGLTGGNAITYFANQLAPAQANSILGADVTSSLYPWMTINSISNNIIGFRDSGSANYSRLKQYHSGTNGSIIFDSQAGGTAGASRDFLFQSNGVTVAKVAINSSYSGAGTKYLSDDGTYKTVTSSGGLANPTASVGLTAVNGVATTGLRSDGAPALDQSIAPTWTGAHIFNSSATFNKQQIFGIQAFTYTNTTVMDLSLSYANMRTESITGDLTITVTNPAAGKWFTLIITADSSTRNLTLPSWIFMDRAAPSTIAANKTMSLTVFYVDTSDSHAIANYAVQP